MTLLTHCVIQVIIVDAVKVKKLIWQKLIWQKAKRFPFSGAN
jgi:hypothetical protein